MGPSFPAAKIPFESGRARSRSGQMQLIFLIGLASLYCLAYLSIGFLPGNSPYPLGWWGWWDQSQYLKSALAFGRWDLDPTQHWYPLTYSLVAGAFSRFQPYHAFFFVNVVSFVAMAWLMMQLAKELGVSALGGAAAFLVGAVFPAVLLAQYIVPWTTTPVAALYIAVILTYVIALREGFTSRRVALITVFVALVAAFRPVDVAPLLPIALHVAWRTVSPGGPAAPITQRLLVPALAGGAVLAAYLGLHVAIYGLRPSVYMQQSSVLGLDPGIIPFRYAVIFGNPRPFFGEGTGLLERYPLMSIGLWALVYLTFWVRSIFAVTAAIWISFMLYLAYPDFLPSGVWRYLNIHYWKWLFPVLAVLTLVALRDAWTKRRHLAVLVSVALTAPLVIASLKADASAPKDTQIRGQEIRLVADHPVAVAAIRLKGVEGGDFETYFGDHQLTLGSRSLRHIADFRMMRVADEVFVVPNRPLEASEALLVLDPRLAITSAFQASLIQPKLGLRNPFRSRLSEADRLIPWRAMPKADQKCAKETARTDVYPSSDGEFINLAYVALLGRLPDAESFINSCDAVVSGRLKRGELIQTILKSPEYSARSK